MRMRILSKVAALGTVAAGALGAPIDTLKEQLQQVLDGVVAAHKGDAALQLGWKSASMEFALAAGVVPQPSRGASASRPTTLEDTFLFGSGTKPLTATAVMALRDKGLLSLDDPLEKHVDTLLQQLKLGTTLRGLFGEKAGAMTVGHVVRMQSGVADFDAPTFDNFLLQANETYSVHSPLDFIQFASTQPAICDPGACVSYSSTNFILAGLVLFAHSGAKEWSDMDILALLPASAKPKLAHSRFFSKENLQSLLTVPGHTGGGWAKTPETLIWNQSSSILGWTCGNMVGTALDMANFMWALLGPEADMLPAATLAEMQQFKLLNKGWAAGNIAYGIGLMVESVNFTVGHRPTLPEWGSYMGHGGDTYGFLSEQGIVSQLNASLSIVANQDSDGGIVQQQAFCKSIIAAAKVLMNVTLTFRCGYRADEAVIV